ncbi:fibronectin type III domain-containing protein [Phytophthora infestans T30-4]|uniref:Fibronectin type III domain-containing protein n=1 Tax=Phytophthora infestans (strain T30-4) TaxID=403677 RepID=D0N9M2_PHYIT|nr:fibronectin type III domain-containing protein [Phytophthora infestans T30-4]EEY54510.1 fibronectin type III domain-containing protein [Phytophthora infestans T30-4]|eukprot:XP_002904332.1 fibronectin type III domain-containing protein [Phytophthora infestans T30-4]
MQDLDVVNEFNRVWPLSDLRQGSREVQVDRQVYAELQRVAPGNPVSAYALVSWSAFDNALEASGGTASVEAYEVQYAVSGSGVWQSLGDSLTGFRVDLGAQATEHVPKQRIFTRADDGESINDGYFRLGLSYEGSSPSILGGRATAGVVTPPIAFDASADAMKTAIESLEQVTQVQVERNALDADGAFESIILLDLVAYDGEDPLPLLSLYTETVSAQWTGDGDQVAVQYLRMAPSSPGRHGRICSDECSYQVTGLQTGRAFSFRVRAQYSEFFPVTSFQAQQQCDSEIGWTTITRQQCANTQDWYYVQLTGNGGSGGSTSGDEAKPGEHGAVLVFPVTWSGERPAEHSFFYTGSVQTYRVPIDQSAPHLAHRIVALDVYAWGAGGAGARSSNGASSDLSNGGGGAFARGVFRVSAGDAVDILVGGGGLQDGRGGFNGGGNGGTGDFPGGGGGGASEVRVNGRTAVVAAGGGGAGSTDYCCAHGGGGGGLDEAESGLAPDATTIPLDSRVTGQAARDEYHSSNVPGDTRDFEGLPARHGHLDWGFAASSADYSVLATGGTGATPTTAGVAGTAGSYRYSLEGTCLLNPQTSLVDVAVSPLTASHWPSNGRNGSGGSGQSGKQAGGGGGGGFFGGGGGGAGVDGAGGGGGSSFVSFRDLFNSFKSGISDASLRARVSDEIVDKLRVTPLTSSSVKVSWKAPRFGFSQLVEGFVIEMANRSVNEDFRLVRLVTLPATDVTEKSGTLTLHGLTPTAAYRFRVKALLLDGRGTFSDVVTLRMPTKPRNTWRRCVTRTVDEENTRAGMRVTNTPPLQRFPSARRGHSLTLLDNSLYLFGGMAKSYECSRAHKVPCLLQPSPRSVSNDFWRYDLRTETWWSVPPPALVPSPREKHSMAVVNDRLILFGGRQNDVSDANDASTWGPRALNDLWELSVSSSTAKQTSVSLDSRQPSALSIPDGGQVFALGRKSGSAGGGQLCVVNVSVSVQITHACPHTLGLQVFGPGPATFPGRQQSAHFPVDSQARETTWSDSQGLRSLQGDKRATGTAPNARAFPVLLRSPDEAADKSECAPGTEKLQFVSTSSLEALSVFHQLPVAGNWTLELTDTAADGFVGNLDSWDVTFDVAPCVPAFTWTNLSPIATGTAPTARFQHSVVVVGSSMFIFGGTAGGTGSELSDLYRLDYTPSVALGVAPTARWTQLASLTDRESPSIAERRVHAGRTTLLTPFELMAVGRGLKSPRRASLGSRTAMAASRFESQLDVRLKRLEDLIDGWRTVATTSGEDESALDEQRPVPRYWAASVFVSSLPGSKVPRVFLFGGQDDTTLLDDFWSLELAQLDEDFPQDRRKSQRIRACAWRQENSVYRTQWTSSCGASNAAAAVDKCTLEMLLLYAWCDEYYQSIRL